MADPLPLSGVVITFNEADRLERGLRSLLAVCRDVIVVDSGSTDGTPELARRLGARVIDQPWLGFGRQKNLAIAQAAQPWVLLLDADEWLEPDALAELRALFASSTLDHADIVTLQRRTHFLGSVMRFGSFAREPVHRLFRAHCRHEPMPVHERFITEGQRVRASTVRMEHDTARSAEEYWTKLQRYAGLWAEERAARGKRAGAGRGAAAAAAYLLKNLVLRGGLLDGPGAWRFHALHARYVALKYDRLRALTRPQPGN
jgi:(heptosyl)LPS beta-1,4-glucosyltransferase